MLLLRRLDHQLQIQRNMIETYIDWFIQAVAICPDIAGIPSNKCRVFFSCDDKCDDAVQGYQYLEPKRFLTIG